MNMIPGADVQAVIARHVLGNERENGVLGEIALHPHQREGASRARHLLDTHGGALIADDVGLGKTYLALAVARHSRRPVVVAPAALRIAWEQAARATQVAIPFVSLESLARGRSAGIAPDLVVIDEAQHLRNGNTRRFAACRSLCGDAKVLLLSATPIQNRVADLRVLLSLFLGERAQALSVEALAQLVVRREAADVVGAAALTLPVADAPRLLHPGDDVDCLERIVALPPPLTAADAGDGGALLTYTLVRQWASSRAALCGALSRRVAKAHALEDSLLAGRLPTRAELAAWTFAGGAQQLAFPLIAATTVPRDIDALLARVRGHREGVHALLAWLGVTPDPDDSRANLLRDLAAEHPLRRIVAFSEYADTVAALYRKLLPHLRVAMLTHAGGRVAGGRTTRRELITAFAPGARTRAHERDRVDLLLTTDVLSEGVGLQDASIVVHLDVPWNPARMTQRVGRVRRLGAAEPTVSVYAMAPPAPAERMLELEARLRRKMDDAARTIGVAHDVLPGIGASRDASQATQAERRATALREWRTRGDTPMAGAPVCGAVRGSRNGALLCVRVDGIEKLLAFDGRVQENAAVVDEFIRCASHESVAVDAEARDAVLSAIQGWLRERATAGLVDLPARRVAQSRRALLRRTEQIARATPRHARAALQPLLFAARGAAAASLSAGAELALEDLTRAPLGDEAWLRALGEFASSHAAARGADGLIAVLLLVSRDGSACQ